MSLQSEAAAVAIALGQRVRAARLRRQWTTELLADKLGVSDRTVRKVEHGQTSVSVRTYLEACILLDVDFSAPLEAHVMSKRSGRVRAAPIAPGETDF